MLRQGLEGVQPVADAAQRDQPVWFVNERAVFRLTPDGLLLTEVAPGIDLERDILGQMEFKPVISKELREMASDIFGESSLPGLREAFGGEL